MLLPDDLLSLSIALRRSIHTYTCLLAFSFCQRHDMNPRHRPGRPSPRLQRGRTISRYDPAIEIRISTLLALHSGYCEEFKGSLARLNLSTHARASQYYP